MIERETTLTFVRVGKQRYPSSPARSVRHKHRTDRPMSTAVTTPTTPAVATTPTATAPRGGVWSNESPDLTMTTSANQTPPPPPQSPPPRHVVFVHLDWGIGGAEQLMLQLCVASVRAGHRIDLVTTHCDPTHCFALLQPADRRSDSLYPYLHVWGNWLPTSLGAGRGQALCSTVRLLYLACRVARGGCGRQPPDLIVLDVLPTPLWIFRYWTTSSLLFYCHFPDQLLIRSNEKQQSNVLFRWYRTVLNWIEERSMNLADTVTVNSKFTRQTVLNTFPSLSQNPLPVLYPALDIGTDFDASPATETTMNKKNSNLIVSLNRFERKKNLSLLIETAAWMKEHHPSLEPEIVVAGGYDPRNVENVEYRGELGRLAEELGVVIHFRHSISDTDRRALLETATAVVYTPANEHFGIVPVEAMYAGTAVVAAHSGGPTETILHETTGYLCDTTAAAFGKALAHLLEHPDQAVAMGVKGRQHVIATFGPDRLLAEWKQLTTDTYVAGQKRVAAAAMSYRVISPRTILYVCEAAVTLCVCWFLTWILRHFTILEPCQSLLGGMRKAVQSWRDEL